MIFQIFIFSFSILILAFLGSKLIKTLTRLANFLNIRGFVIAFFLMAFATSLTNFFFDLGSAVAGVPELSLGDILGGNLVDLTLVMALVIFFSKEKISANSKMVQSSAVFTAIAVILPLILILDGRLTRIDGIILYMSFIAYSIWIFSKRERFKNDESEKINVGVFSFFQFIKDIFIIIILLVLLVISTQVIIYSAQSFAEHLNMSLSLVGVLIVGLANCFPEAYFSIVAAKKGDGWLVLGEMMGSVIICATLILGTVAIVSPFEIKDMSSLLIARIFTIIAAIFFLVAIKTDRAFTKKEGLILLGVYIAFLLVEIFKPQIF